MTGCLGKPESPCGWGFANRFGGTGMKLLPKLPAHRSCLPASQVTFSSAFVPGPRRRAGNVHTRAWPPSSWVRLEGGFTLWLPGTRSMLRSAVDLPQTEPSDTANASASEQPKGKRGHVAPSVSVVCLAYNSMKFLPRTIDSVLSQTFTDFELVLVDDGSADNVVDWASRQSDLRFRLVSQANQGIAGARNRGIREARGEYIAFLDGDDLWHPQKLEFQVDVLNRHPEVGLVHTHVELIDAQGRHLGYSKNMGVHGDARAAILVSNFVGTASVTLIRRRCFDELGGFLSDPSVAWCDDWDMWVRIAMKYSFALVPQPLTRYRLHPNGASTKYHTLVPLVPSIVSRLYESAAPELGHLRPKTLGTFYAYLGLLALGAKHYREASRLFRRALTYQVSSRWLASGCQIGASVVSARASRLWR